MAMPNLTLTAPAPRELDPLALIESDIDLQPSTKYKYTRVLRAYLDTGGDLHDAQALGAFAAGLSNSQRSFLRSAVVKWADRLATVTRGSATPENVRAVDATLHRLTALKESIQVTQPKGSKGHTWLSQKEVRQLYALTGPGIEGDRDRAALGVLLAAGLRREEAVNLAFDHISYKPIKDRMRAVLAVRGKGAKNREVPISDVLAGHLDAWRAHLDGAGAIVRSLGRNLEPGDGMSGPGLFELVRRYGIRLGKPQLAPHDLRRTYAQIGFEAGVPITQISVLLGHSSVAITQRYLDLSLDLEATASDFVPWG